MKLLGQVRALHLGDGPGLPKSAVTELFLLAGHGALGDRHAGRDPYRAVLVCGLQSYQIALAAGIELPAGALGENLLLDLDPTALLGEVLEVGNARLWLHSVCPVCQSLTQFDPRLAKLLYKGRGVYAQVLQSGSVAVGDAVGGLAAEARG